MSSLREEHHHRKTSPAASIAAAAVSTTTTTSHAVHHQHLLHHFSHPLRPLSTMDSGLYSTSDSDHEDNFPANKPHDNSLEGLLLYEICLNNVPLSFAEFRSKYVYLTLVVFTSYLFTINGFCMTIVCFDQKCLGINFYLDNLRHHRF